MLFVFCLLVLNPATSSGHTRHIVPFGIHDYYKIEKLASSFRVGSPIWLSQKGHLAMSEDGWSTGAGQSNHSTGRGNVQVQASRIIQQGGGMYRCRPVESFNREGECTGAGQLNHSTGRGNVQVQASRIIQQGGGMYKCRPVESFNREGECTGAGQSNHSTGRGNVQVQASRIIQQGGGMYKCRPVESFNREGECTGVGQLIVNRMGCQLRAWNWKSPLDQSLN